MSTSYPPLSQPAADFSAAQLSAANAQSLQNANSLGALGSQGANSMQLSGFQNSNLNGTYYSQQHISQLQLQQQLLFEEWEHRREQMLLGGTNGYSPYQEAMIRQYRLRQDEAKQREIDAADRRNMDFDDRLHWNVDRCS